MEGWDEIGVGMKLFVVENSRFGGAEFIYSERDEVVLYITYLVIAQLLPPSCPSLCRGPAIMGVSILRKFAVGEAPRWAR